MLLILAGAGVGYVVAEDKTKGAIVGAVVGLGVGILIPLIFIGTVAAAAN
jgi:glycerol uptake facilitator-like aquaporin